MIAHSIHTFVLHNNNDEDDDDDDEDDDDDDDDNNNNNNICTEYCQSSNFLIVSHV